MMIIGIVFTTVNNGCVLITLDFLLLNQAFFLLTNLFKQTLAGSSLGSCGTSFPSIAHCNMLFFNCFPFIVLFIQFNSPQVGDEFVKHVSQILLTYIVFLKLCNPFLHLGLQ